MQPLHFASLSLKIEASQCKSSASALSKLHLKRYDGSSPASFQRTSSSKIYFSQLQLANGGLSARTREVHLLQFRMEQVAACQSESSVRRDAQIC